MFLATINSNNGAAPVAVDRSRGVAAVRDVIPGAPDTTMGVIEQVANHEFVTAVRSASDSVFRPLEDVRFEAPYRHPRKIWGIGLNYVEHAADLTESVPDEPASFMKGDHTIIGAGEPIPIPGQSQRVTVEAELGLVMGRHCYAVDDGSALDHVWGVCTLLDQTAEDILARNPRFLTRSKNFPGFFSFGPAITPLSEVGPLADLEVRTLLNGEVHRQNKVALMRYSPEFLVAFHSQVMPFFPGDLLATGTPGAAHVRAGDSAGCVIPGVGELSNPVTEA